MLIMTISKKKKKKRKKKKRKKKKKMIIMILKEYKSKFDPAGVPFVIEKFTAHCLRHTHATNLFHCGKDILYVQHQLGHSKPETTLNIYTHLVKDNSISKTNKVISFDKYIEKISKEQNAKHA